MDEISSVPKILADGEGMPYVMGPQEMTIKLSSAETSGAFAFAEVKIDEPAFGPPYHVHTREDEMFTVLEGELHLILDGKRHVVLPGGMAYAPRNVPHRFESGPNGVRFNVMITGSNFEVFHRRYSEAFAAGNMAAIPTIAAEHGITFLPEM